MTPNVETCRNVAFYVSSMSRDNAKAALRTLITALYDYAIKQGCEPHEAIRFTSDFGDRVTAEIEAILLAPSGVRH
jgi:hypothetical protein